MENQQLFRLCHVCDTLNEGDVEILKCSKCQKGFLPIHYFEKIRARAIQAGQLTEEAPVLAYNPLPGLIVFW